MADKLAELAAGLGAALRLAEPLHRYTSFRIGGPADAFLSPSSPDELARALRLAWELRVPCTVLGGGSNLLVADAGVRGLVIRVGRGLSWIRGEGRRLDVGAGTSFPALAREAARRNLTGLEFAAGIPGTVGGAVAMNAGAHDGDISRWITRVGAVSRDGRPVTLRKEEMAFGYRTSRLLGRQDLVVVSAELELPEGDPARIREKMQAYLKRRRRTQPLGTKNAGSIFKNPPGDYAGRLIEAAGCKGWREGGAVVSDVHANFIVNTGHATAAQVLRLVERVREAVRRAFGVELELEVELVGFAPEPAPRR